MKQNLVWGVVAVALLVVGVNFPLNVKTVTERVIQQVGGSTANSAHQFFDDGVTIGGFGLATTTGVTLTSYTLSAREMSAGVVKINPSVDLTLLISATSSGSLVPKLGDSYTFLLQNASSTVGSSLTLDNADGSVVPLLVEATGADLVLAGLNWAQVTVIRTGTSGTNALKFLVTEFVPG